MPRAKTPEEVLDRFLDTASKDRLVRLYSDVRACLRFKHGMFNDGDDAPARKPRKAKDGAQPKLEGISGT